MKRSLVYLALLSAAVFAACAKDTARLDTPPPETAEKAAVNEIAPAEAFSRTQAAYAQFVDVRTPEEFAGGHASRAINIPLNELEAKLGRLERNEPVYLICKSGKRSKEASDILVKNGFNWVFNVTGGTNDWQSAGLPIEVPKPKA